VTPPAHRGLLDTSVVLDLGVISPDDLPAYPVISAITLAELSAGPAVATTEHQRAQRQIVLQFAESSFDPIPFDASCARRFASVASSLRASGRTGRSRGLDALIAATALAHDLPLFTCNERDFRGIDALEVHPVPR
jgi:tRNA(fMet)-specific endonuclease VapC